MKKEVLRMSGICLNEAEIEIVRDGELHVFESEIVGVVGRSHAGKSSLLGAATGEFPCESGRIWIDEKSRRIESIHQARKAGVFLIKGTSSLIDEFTIKDTMKLNYAFIEKRVRYKEYLKRCRGTLDFLNVKEAPDTRIRTLNFHTRMLIEIAQALICEGRILVLDNVVSMLSSTAREELHKVFAMLKLRGISVILVENQADIIKAYLDRLYVMRKGRVVAEFGKAEMTEEQILALIEGGPFVSKPGGIPRKVDIDTSKKILEFEKVSTADLVIKDLSFELYEDECLGIWNRNRHSGQGILDVLSGAVELVSGTVRVEARLFMIPEVDQLFSNMTVGGNIELAALKKYAYGGVIPMEGEIRYLVQDLCSDYFTDDPYHRFASQVIPDNALIRKKVLLCRAIAAGAKIIVYNNPSLKLDVREKEIFNQDILRTQKKRIGQIIIAAHLDDLYPVCNRIIQIDNGKNNRIIKNG